MEASSAPMSSAMLKVARELAGTVLSTGLRGLSLYHVGDVQLASVALGFWMSSQHSNPQSEEPSGRYQVLAGAVTPMEQWASGQAAPAPVQYMVRSTLMALPSSALHLGGEVGGSQGGCAGRPWPGVCAGMVHGGSGRPARSRSCR